VKEGLIWRIGNGESVPIWGAKWVPIKTTYCVQSPPSPLADIVVGRDLIDQNTLWWHQKILEENSSPEEVWVIKSILISSTNQLDVQIWRGTAQGDFSVRSAYHMAKEMEIQNILPTRDNLCRKKGKLKKKKEKEKEKERGHVAHQKRLSCPYQKRLSCPSIGL
jgi:hypothetical protein